MAILYFDSTNPVNGDGLTPATPYNTPPVTAFGADTWNLAAGSTWDAGASALTGTTNTILQKWGTGPDPIIQGSANPLLNISTANQVTITDVVFVRTGGGGGTGLAASFTGAAPSTSGLTMTRGGFVGFGVCLNLDRSDNATLDSVSFSGTTSTLGISAGAFNAGDVTKLKIRNCRFTGGAGLSFTVSNTADTDGKFTDLELTDNTFFNMPGSAITMRCSANSISTTAATSVTAPSTITRDSAWPVSWAAGKRIFLGGFVNPANFGLFTVASVVGSVLTVVETSLISEGSATGKGVYLIDPDQAYINPQILRNTIRDTGQTPMLIDNFVSGRIANNTIINSAGPNINAAGIEMLAFQDTVVEDNFIKGMRTSGSVDAMGIFADGGCTNVQIRRNYIADCPGTDRDNSGAGIASFYSIGCVFESNIVVNCKRGYWAGGTAGSGNIVRQNTFANNRVGYRTDSNPPAGYTTANFNLFINNDVALHDSSSSTIATNSYWRNTVDSATGALSAKDASAITVDPQAASDFILANTSPLLGLVSTPTYRKDFFNNERFNPSSVGAVDRKPTRGIRI